MRQRPRLFGLVQAARFLRRGIRGCRLDSQQSLLDGIRDALDQRFVDARFLDLFSCHKWADPLPQR